MNEDARLLDATLAGDPAAFGGLVTRYQDRLYNTLLRLVGSPEDARDLAQDAFLQALAKLHTFQRASAFYTWLYRIAFNLAISRRRRARPTTSIDRLREQTGSEPSDSGPGPEERLAESERAAHVHAALAALGDEHRQILVLRELEGCAYETIAEVLEIPVGTVRSRLFRARMQLRDKLACALKEEIEEIG